MLISVILVLVLIFSVGMWMVSWLFMVSFVSRFLCRLNVNQVWFRLMMVNRGVLGLIFFFSLIMWFEILLDIGVKIFSLFRLVWCWVSVVLVWVIWVVVILCFLGEVLVWVRFSCVLVVLIWFVVVLRLCVDWFSVVCGCNFCCDRLVLCFSCFLVRCRLVWVVVNLVLWVWIILGWVVFVVVLEVWVIFSFDVVVVWVVISCGFDSLVSSWLFLICWFRLVLICVIWFEVWVEILICGVVILFWISRGLGCVVY